MQHDGHDVCTDVWATRAGDRAGLHGRARGDEGSVMPSGYGEAFTSSPAPSRSTWTLNDPAFLRRGSRSGPSA